MWGGGVSEVSYSKTSHYFAVDIEIFSLKHFGVFPMGEEFNPPNPLGYATGLGYSKAHTFPCPEKGLLMENLQHRNTAPALRTNYCEPLCCRRPTLPM